MSAARFCSALALLWASNVEAISIAPRTSKLNEALHHLFAPPTALRTSAQLEALANVRVPSSAGHEILAFAARPSSAREGARLPVLLLLHELFGLNAPIVEKAQALADGLGCVVIAPDTFRGVSTSFIPRAIWLALTTPQKRVNSDLDDVVRWAAQQEYADTRKLAVMGFCYGGGKAIRYTTQARPNAATVIFYGSPVLDVAALRALRAPVLAIYGVDDAQFPQRTVIKFREALAEAGIEHEVCTMNKPLRL
jgi:carboxymethylenebutenolidase